MGSVGIYETVLYGQLHVGSSKLSNDSPVVQQDGTVEFQKVELGRRMGGEYEILSGIADGAEVVTSGQVALKDGIAVERVNE